MKTIKFLLVIMTAFLSGNAMAQKITASNVSIEPGGQASVVFNVESNNPATLAEFELKLPEGLTIIRKKYTGGDILSDSHTVSIKEKKSGNIYVLIMSSEGDEFEPASGELITLTLSAAENMALGDYEIQMRKINLTNLEAKQMNSAKYEEGIIKVEVSLISPITEDEEVSFCEEIDEETNLTDNIIDNTYYTLGTDNGDGYNTEEQAIVLNSTTTEEQMETVQEAKVGDDAVRDNYSGIIFEMPAGKGMVTVDVKTIGTHVLNVQIGKGEPTKVSNSERGMIDIRYHVTEPTYVYIYASSEGNAVRAHRAPSTTENSVLLYGYKVTMLETMAGDANGDDIVDTEDFIEVLKYIMDSPSEKFDKKGADANKDGAVNAADIITIVNIILGN